jgi:hypothetical protein
MLRMVGAMLAGNLFGSIRGSLSSPWGFGKPCRRRKIDTRCSLNCSSIRPLKKGSPRSRLNESNGGNRRAITAITAQNNGGARQALREIPPGPRTAIQRFWQICRFPGDPDYLLSMIHEHKARRACYWILWPSPGGCEWPPFPFLLVDPTAKPFFRFGPVAHANLQTSRVTSGRTSTVCGQSREDCCVCKLLGILRRLASRVTGLKNRFPYRFMRGFVFCGLNML